jgi:uncharacterized protein
MPIIVYIFMALYLLGNYYIYRRVRPIISSRALRRVIAAAIILFFSSYWLAEFGKHILSPGLTPILRWIGSWWIGFSFYAVIILLLIDLVRGVGHVFHLLPETLLKPSPAARRFALSVIGGGVLILLLAGYFNARKLRITTLALNLPPSCGHMKRLNLVFLSDMHLGVMVESSFLEKIINEVNDLNPDIIILVGDTVDMNVQEIDRLGHGEKLSRFNAPLGVYAVTGNHEYITGVDGSVEFLLSSGISLLRDRAVKINNSFYLVGREDLSAGHRFKEGKTLRSILSGLDPGCPIILLDHQPARIDAAVEERVNLLLCGHTHNGQLFPLNLITGAVYKVSNGYKRIGATQIYVTSGAGTWAPPVRIGNVPEIVQLKIEFGPAP